MAELTLEQLIDQLSEFISAHDAIQEIVIITDKTTTRITK